MSRKKSELLSDHVVGSRLVVQSASYLSSRESRALGGRQKGGVAAQAESLADQNKNAGNV